MSASPATWDAYYKLSDRSWALYTCSDCDPEFQDEDTPEDERYDEPFQVVCVDPRPDSRDAACPIDYCPRCGSYLSLGSKTRVRVTTEGTR